MSNTPLEQAIDLVKLGNHSEAQKLLKTLIAEDQHNVAAWFWLVETCTTNRQRIQILEMCLEFNSENQEAQEALKKLRALSPTDSIMTTAKQQKNRSYKSLIILSLASALVLVAINYLLLVLFNQNESTYLVFLVAVVPLTPCLSVPATAIVYAIYSSRHRGFFFATISIPLIFNLIGASTILLLFYWIPYWIQTIRYPPATVTLTGTYSDALGTVSGERSLDVSIGVTTERERTFIFVAHLIANGKIISISSTDASLVPGENTVTFQFLGSDISRYHLNGPYEFRVVSITDWQAGYDIDVQRNSWQTGTYYWNNFGGEIICYSLVVGIRPNPSAATMTISPAPNCTHGQYLADTLVTLKVVPKPGYRFDAWCGDYGEDMRSPKTTLRMDRNMNTAACLEAIP